MLLQGTLFRASITFALFTKHYSCQRDTGARIKVPELRHQLQADTYTENKLLFQVWCISASVSEKICEYYTSTRKLAELMFPLINEPHIQQRRVYSFFLNRLPAVISYLLLINSYYKSIKGITQQNNKK